MLTRKATMDDIPALQMLMYNTITTINSADYSPAQVAIWASRAISTYTLLHRLHEQHVIVAEENASITGFASLDTNGHLDLFYVHKDFQRKGIATLLLQQLLQYARSLHLGHIDTNASITAMPFFERQGFALLNRQIVRIQGITMFTYKMYLPLS